MFLKYHPKNSLHVLQYPGHSSWATQSCAHASGDNMEQLRKWLSVQRVVVAASEDGMM